VTPVSAPKPGPQEIELKLTCDDTAEVVFYDNTIGHEKPYGRTPVTTAAWAGQVYRIKHLDTKEVLAEHTITAHPAHQAVHCGAPTHGEL
jgi:hypothetical protein